MRLRLIAALVAALLFSLGAAPAFAWDALTPHSSAAAEASHVFCAQSASTCFLRDVYVTTGASAGYLLLFAATSAPADGAVTPIDCITAPADSTTGLDLIGRAEVFQGGLTAVFSTTGCFLKTASATAFFRALYQ